MIGLAAEAKPEASFARFAESRSLQEQLQEALRKVCGIQQRYSVSEFDAKLSDLNRRGSLLGVPKKEIYCKKQVMRE